jgi:hypothetical protein
MKLAVRKAYVSLTSVEESPNSEQDSTDQLQRSNLVNALGLPSPPVSMRSPMLARMRPDLDAPPPPTEPGIRSEAAPTSKSPSVITLPSALGLDGMAQASADRIPATLPVSEPKQATRPAATTTLTSDPSARPTAAATADARARFEATRKTSRQASPATQPNLWTWLAAGMSVVALLLAAYLLLRQR